MKKPEIGTFFFVTEVNRNMFWHTSRGDICVVCSREDAIKALDKYLGWDSWVNWPDNDRQVYAINLNHTKNDSHPGTRIGTAATFRKYCEVI